MRNLALNLWNSRPLANVLGSRLANWSTRWCSSQTPWCLTTSAPYAIMPYPTIASKTKQQSPNSICWPQWLVTRDCRWYFAVLLPLLCNELASHAPGAQAFYAGLYLFGHCIHHVFYFYLIIIVIVSKDRVHLFHHSWSFCSILEIKL